MFGGPWSLVMVAAAAAWPSLMISLLVVSSGGGSGGGLGFPTTTADATAVATFVACSERNFSDVHRPRRPPNPPIPGGRKIGVLVVPGDARSRIRMIRRDDEAYDAEGEASRRSPPPPLKQQQKPEPSRNGRKEPPRIPILDYRDDYVCVNKPAGITVHRGRNTPPTSRVLSTSLKRQLSRKVYPVHRLDHRTSGAMLFAFTSEVCGELHGMLRAEGATKRYVALLRGKFGSQRRRRRCEEDAGAGVECVKWDGDDVVTVNSPLKVDGVEKEASTLFTRLASWDGEDGHHDPNTYSGACTLVAATLVRGGRTHQIRRHAYRMGHPVIGDSEHGDSRVNRFWRVRRGLDRLALHCLLLDLPPHCPRLSAGVGGGEHQAEGGCGVRCVAPLPDDLASVLRAVGMTTQPRADADSDKASPSLASSSGIDAATGTTPFWEEAVLREPLLAKGFYDFRGGTLGRRRQNKKRTRSQLA